MLKFLMITQVFPPDPAAVGQYFDEAAQALHEAGAEVKVLTANRGYDNPDECFEPFENRGGVQIYRLPASSFGKASMVGRLLGQLSFLVQSLFRALFTRDLTDLLVSTSPPMCGVVAVVVGWLRPSIKIHYWVMDLNPDQAVALGVFGAKHPFVLAMDWLNRRILKRANTVIALDRFMEARLLAKLGLAESSINHQLLKNPILVLPPWPMGQHVSSVVHAENWFRKEQGWADKFVVMFSGNHSWVHPLTTILDAAERLKDDPRFLFVFIGGGKGKQAVEDRIERWKSEVIEKCEIEQVRDDPLINDSSTLPETSSFYSDSSVCSQPAVVSLPYQPLDNIRYSLSAADLHVVSLGNNMSGIVHPCKVYGALGMGRPVLALGPKDSYLNDLFSEGAFGWSIAHGDLDGAVKELKAAADLSDAERQAMGKRGQILIVDKYSRHGLLEKFVQVVVAR